VEPSPRCAPPIKKSSTACPKPSSVQPAEAGEQWAPPRFALRIWLPPLRRQLDFLDCGSPAAAFSYASLLAFAGGGAAKLSPPRGRKINIPSRQQGCPGPKRQQAAAVQGLRPG
jgi:hypothetical protein